MLLGILLAVGGAKAQSALFGANLMGRWCAESVSHEFAPNQLIVSSFIGQPQKIFPFTSISINGNVVRVDLRMANSTAHTLFGELRGNEMAQLYVEAKVGAPAVPRREFHRC